jgi:hypothetical protein
MLGPFSGDQAGCTGAARSGDRGMLGKAQVVVRAEGDRLRRDGVRRGAEQAAPAESGELFLEVLQRVGVLHVKR